MSIEEILKNLEILEIKDANQLENNDIKYWWEKKYLSIRYSEKISNDEKNDLLIKVNAAKDLLIEQDIDYLKECLRGKNKKENNSNYDNRSQNYASNKDPWGQSDESDKSSKYRYTENNYSNSNNKKSENNNYYTSNNNYNNKYTKENNSNNFFSPIKKFFTESFYSSKSVNLDNPIQGILSALFIGPIVVAILCSIFNIDPVEVFVGIYILLIIYFFPTVIARSRRHRNFLAIFALNLFLGWTFLGWLFSLIWSLNNR